MIIGFSIAKVPPKKNPGITYHKETYPTQKSKRRSFFST